MPHAPSTRMCVQAPARIQSHPTHINGDRWDSTGVLLKQRRASALNACEAGPTAGHQDSYSKLQYYQPNTPARVTARPLPPIPKNGPSSTSLPRPTTMVGCRCVGTAHSHCSCDKDMRRINREKHRKTMNLRTRPTLYLRDRHHQRLGVHEAKHQRYHLSRNRLDRRFRQPQRRDRLCLGRGAPPRKQRVDGGDSNAVYGEPGFTAMSPSIKVKPGSTMRSE